MPYKKSETKDFTVNGNDLDNFYCIPAKEYIPFCSSIGKTKAYCIYCKEITEFTIVFFDRDYTMGYICNSYSQSQFGCHWMYAVTLDKINTQDMRNIWKPLPRRTIYDLKE